MTQIPYVQCEGKAYCAECGEVIKEVDHEQPELYAGSEGQYWPPRRLYIPGSGTFRYKPCGHVFLDYGYVIHVSPRGEYLPKHAKITA